MSGDIEAKVRTALRINAAKINQLHFAIGLGSQTYNQLGYVIKTINSKNYTEYVDAQIRI